MGVVQTVLMKSDSLRCCYTHRYNTQNRIGNYSRARITPVLNARTLRVVVINT